MESFGQIILSGLLIGVLVSAPMGPVGMLIIQRTLNKGRWPAFFTGIGAALSDVFYCLLTGLGLSFITDFIETHNYLLQIIGSVVLVAFAIYLFQKNPARALHKRRENKTTFFKDLGTGFLFTISNPLILFFIIGLFGRFNFLLPEFQYYHYILGYVAIFVGALLWWYLITFGVNKIRSHFNVRSMWFLNRIIGTILIIMALVGIYKSVSGYIKRNNDNEQITTHSVY
ncbi:MAG: LysE family translocator [Bacteroidales bacterium]|nr:LysE family translocator [Bacteroidales bacterium]MBD5235313.1 LysE family translocator [Barnesiella sp.]MBD5247455.1 LysE family translocator [Barnesiella sp.]MBD5258539.1 LysE family translocator [Barnesiella sp.]